MNAVNEMMEFIRRAPTPFHAVEHLCEMLSKAGFTRLEEREIWRLEPGGQYFLTRNRSSVIAFRLPQSGALRFQIVASHSDSPAFRLKPLSARDSQGCALMNVEPYGGAIMSTWFDRPLCVAGRAIVRTPEGLQSRLVCLDRDLALIPNLPIHFNRKVNDGVKLNPQADLIPVLGAEGSDLMALVAQAAGVEKQDIADCDLFLVNGEAPRLWGANREYIAAPRLDDLECAYTSVRALIEAAPGGHIDMACVFDNEEVGSGTRQGADSTLLAETLKRIASALSAPPQALEAALAGSFMVSADNAHAVHPNHPELYDEQNRVRMNGGVVIKNNASQKYTTDALSAAVFSQVCASAGVPVQRFSNRSDIPGGSTLGNIANAHASMSTVDVGLAQLSMHSACESAGALDVEYMLRALKAFYEAEIDICADSEARIR